MRLLVDSNNIDRHIPKKKKKKSSLCLTVQANCFFFFLHVQSGAAEMELVCKNEVSRSLPAAQADILNRPSFDLER